MAFTLDSILQLFGVKPKQPQEILSPLPENPMPQAELEDKARNLAAAHEAFHTGEPHWWEPHHGEVPVNNSNQDIATVQPQLYDAIMALQAADEVKRNLMELSGQESSYGYAGPHISDVEQSYGPFHVNLMAGRINPNTGKPFTRAEAEDINSVVQYALEEYNRTGGLGAWNPGAYDFYQKEIPERAKKKKYVRGK